MADSSPPSGGTQLSGQDDPEAPPATWRLMRCVMLASLVPFFLIFPGSLWVFVDIWVDVDVFISSEMAVAVVSLSMLCLAGAVAITASAAINSGRRPTAGEMLSKMKGMWREPSIARAYWTILLLGYVLFLILHLFVFLLMYGGGISWRVLVLLLCLLALLFCLYVGVVASVGMGAFLLEESVGGVEALWRAAELVEEEKLLGFLVFFLSLPVIALLFFRLWIPGPVWMNAAWMLGAGGLFVYAGVLLQI